MQTPTSSKDRFSDRVENYVRYRPGYPPEIIKLLAEKTGLSERSVVADIGSGTGISSELLLRTGCTVFAIEPNAGMRAAAEQILPETYPAFHSIDGSAEATTLDDQSVDLIVAAQAFHWFDHPQTRAEFSRILKPGGHVVLIWNERQIDTTPFLIDYEELLNEFGTDYNQVRHENVEATLDRFFLSPPEIDTFQNNQYHDREALKGRLLSSSYAPPEGHPRHEEMIKELDRIFDLHQTDGKICFEYITRIYIGK